MLDLRMVQPGQSIHGLSTLFDECVIFILQLGGYLLPHPGLPLNSLIMLMLDLHHPVLCHLDPGFSIASGLDVLKDQGMYGHQVIKKLYRNNVEG